MKTFTARVIRTVLDEHAATLSVEADTLEEAMDAFEEMDLSEFQDQQDYHSADECTHHYKKWVIDGVPAQEEGSQE